MTISNNIISLGVNYGGDTIVLVHKDDSERQDIENVKYVTVNIDDRRVDEGDSLGKLLEFVPAEINDPKDKSLSDLDLLLVQQK